MRFFLNALSTVYVIKPLLPFHQARGPYSLKSVIFIRANTLRLMSDGPFLATV